MNAQALILCLGLCVTVVLACGWLEVFIGRRRARYGKTKIEYVDWR
jgi:hypothetical protein